MNYIFIEGKEDFFLKHLVSHLNLDNSIEYKSISGYTNLPNFKNDFKINSDQSGKNLILFDADSPPAGGFAKRLQVLQSQLLSLNIAADVFLFPNNRENGEYENLLTNIINRDNENIFQCFENYENCLSDSNYSTPNIKSKIFAYLECLNISKSDWERRVKKGDFLFENNQYWDFNSQYLDPLSDFLRNNLI